MFNTFSARARLGACALLVSGIFVIVFQPASSIGQAAAGGNLPGYNDEFAKLGFKFEGAASCSNAQCHGADEPKDAKGIATTYAEFTQWTAGDLHAKAYEQLTSEAGVAMAEKMKIEPTDARCVACHAMPAPEKLQGKDFNIEEGVSCGACHGPSEKWTGPHKEKGWTDKQRAAFKTHDALLKKTGLYDTKSPLARADMCTSCHLAIDADMVDAGHPQPVFELDYFSRSEEKGGIYVSQHWRDPNIPFYNVSLWATGQIVALRDAMTQLAERANAKGTKPNVLNDAYLQAMAHYSMVKPIVTAGGVKGDAKAWETQAQKIAAGIKGKKSADVAAGAKAIAAEAAKLAPTVSSAKFDKAKTLAMIKALLSDTNTSKLYGAQGKEQQTFALYGLHASYAGPAGKETTDFIMNTLMPEEGELDAAGFAAGLKSISGKVK